MVRLETTDSLLFGVEVLPLLSDFRMLNRLAKVVTVSSDHLWELTSESISLIRNHCIASNLVEGQKLSLFVVFVTTTTATANK